MKFKYSDGGRSQYFAANNVGDCVTRAIANATGLDYMLIYKSLTKLGGRSVRNGCAVPVYKKLLEAIGLPWKATMQIGGGCRVHLEWNEIPKGTLIIRVSRHLTCAKDRILYDTYDCSRGGDRCVYGYWRVPSDWNRSEAEARLQRFLKSKRKRI